MIETIHVDPKLEKCLSVLRKGGRRACLAADRIDVIIEELKNGATPPGEISNFTRNGEGRIKGCRKYDLGAGYRLVTLKREKDLYVLFAGTHDECSRWIDNIRMHLTMESIAERSAPMKWVRQKNEKPSPTPSSQDGIDPDEDWISPISDKDLRIVFSGLVEGR